jgi:hypothetical protein
MKNFTKTVILCLTLFSGFIANAQCTLTTAFTQSGNSITVTGTGFMSIMIPQFTVNWGDGTPNTSVGGTVLNETHAYAANGNYTISINFTDIIDQQYCNVTNNIPISITSITSLCNATASANGNTISTTTPGTSFQWISCPNFAVIPQATNASFLAAGSGSYAVIVTNANGCIDTSNCVTINALCSINSSITISQNTASVTGTGAGSIMIPQYIINWGDGSALTTVQSALLPSTSHLYAAPGNYTICVEFSDQLSGSGCLSQECTPITIGVQSCTATATLSGNTISTTNTGTTFAWLNCSLNQVIQGQNSNSYSPLLSGSYAVIVTTSSGCIDTSNCIQYTAPQPTCVVTATVNQNVCSTAATGTYKWVNCPSFAVIPGATSAMYTATINGNYAVIVTNPNGCIDTSNCVQVSGVGLDDITIKSIIAYPNPTTGQFTIQGIDIENAILAITNVSGQELSKMQLTSNNLSVAALSKGVYFITIYQNGLEYRSKIVKE